MFRKRISESLGSYGTTPRTRRGAKLGIVIAIMLALPGLVAGTAYISGSSTGTLTGATANVAGAVCGWWKDAALDNQVSATAITGTYASGGTVAPTSGTITVTANVIDSANYEYLVDEVVWGCEDTPTTGTITVSFTIGSVLHLLPASTLACHPCYVETEEEGSQRGQQKEAPH